MDVEKLMKANTLRSSWATVVRDQHEWRRTCSALQHNTWDHLNTCMTLLHGNKVTLEM